MARTAASLVAALVASSVVACTPALRLTRPYTGECLHADASSWAKLAAASLVTVPLVAGRVFDVGREDAPPVAISPAEGAELVQSYPDPNRFEGAPDGFDRLSRVSYLYDDALLALYRTSVGDEAGARRVLDALAALQRVDGAWGFSIRPSDGFYNSGYVRNGVVAFIVYAYAKYALAFGDHRYRAIAGKGAEFLLSLRERSTGLILAGYGRWDTAGKIFSPDYVADFAATEHQIDAFFALAALGAVDPGGPWLAHARALDTSMSNSLYVREEARFAQGCSPRGRDLGSALDASGTWAALYHVAQNRPFAARSSLDWVSAHHTISVAGWSGLRPYSRQPPDTWFVEGGVAFALAASRMGHRVGEQTVDELAVLACTGGVPLVASPRWEPDFPLTPSAAATLWFLFAVQEVKDGAPPFLWIEGA